jgi:hypothetical protein
VPPVTIKGGGALNKKTGKKMPEIRMCLDYIFLKENLHENTLHNIN